jgi:hypothetical protein
LICNKKRKELSSFLSHLFISNVNKSNTNNQTQYSRDKNGFASPPKSYGIIFSLCSIPPLNILSPSLKIAELVGLQHQV